MNLVGLSVAYLTHLAFTSLFPRRSFIGNRGGFLQLVSAPLYHCLSPSICRSGKGRASTSNYLLLRDCSSDLFFESIFLMYVCLSGLPMYDLSVSPHFLPAEHESGHIAIERRCTNIHLYPLLFFVANLRVGMSQTCTSTSLFKTIVCIGHYIHF